MKGEQMKAWRERYGWNQTMLAICLGVGQATISRWESGKVKIPWLVAFWFEKWDEPRR